MQDLILGSDNRSGAISALSNSSSSDDPKQGGYNSDPGEDEFGPIDRDIAVTDGEGDRVVGARLATKSEFLDRANGKCSGLRLASSGTITPPANAAAPGLAIVQDRLALGFQVDGGSIPAKLRLKATIDSDIGAGQIKLTGPSFAEPLIVEETHDGVVTLDKPGEYILTAAYQLVVKLPNEGLAGRPVTINMKAELVRV